jgi:hypothetical protein
MGIYHNGHFHRPEIAHPRKRAIDFIGNKVKLANNSGTKEIFIYNFLPYLILACVILAYNLYIKRLAEFLYGPDQTEQKKSFLSNTRLIATFYLMCVVLWVIFKFSVFLIWASGVSWHDLLFFVSLTVR